MQPQTPGTLALDEAIVAHIAEAVIYASRDGTIERWNSALVLMFGFSAAEAIGLILDLMSPEHLRVAHWRGFDAGGRIVVGANRGWCRASVQTPLIHPWSDYRYGSCEPDFD